MILTLLCIHSSMYVLTNILGQTSEVYDMCSRFPPRPWGALVTAIPNNLTKVTEETRKNADICHVYLSERDHCPIQVSISCQVPPGHWQLLVSNLPAPPAFSAM